MKKQNKLIKRLLLSILLVSSMVLWNCEKEDLELTTELQEKTEIKIESLTYSQVKNEIDFDLFNISKPKKTKKGLLVSKLKTYQKNSDDLEVDMTVIKKIEKENSISYTMRAIKSDNNNSIFNVVLDKKGTKNKLYILEYIPSNDWLVNPFQGFEGSIQARGGVPFDGHASDSDGDGGGNYNEDYTLVCEINWVTYYVPCGCGHTEPSQCSGCNYAPTRPIPYFELEETCHYELIGNIGDNSGSSNNSSPHGSSGSSSSNNSNVVVTSPVIPEGDENLITNCLDPSTQELDWLNTSQSNNIALIWDYINANGCDSLTKRIIIRSIYQDIANPNTFEVAFLVRKLNRNLCVDLTTSQEDWVSQNMSDANQILNYLNNDTCSNVNFDTLTETLELSENSPFNLDTSELVDNILPLPDDGTPEAIKLKCIYEKLTQSPKFKQLFVDTFGQSENVNIKFEIVDMQPNSNNQIADASTNANVLDVRMQTIKLDRAKLLSNHPLVVAQAIIHEALHAFINVKQVYCHNNGMISTGTNQTYITNLNQLTFDELLNDFYIDCAVNQPAQHRLMYNQMVGVLDEMLAEVFDDLVATEDQDLTNNPIYMYPPNGNQHSFNWQDAFHYMNLNGLQEANEYQQDILQNPSISYLVGKYDYYLNETQSFNHDSCN